MNIQEFRQQYPQYQEVPDEELSRALHKKFYSQVPYETFSEKFGTKVEKSYADRILTEGLPAVANIGGDLLRSVPAGIRGAGEAALTGSMQRGLEGFESSMEQLKEATPRFSGVEGTEAAFQEGFEQHVARPLGELAGETASGTTFNLAPDSQLGVRPQPGAETFGEAMANFLPIPGTKLVGRLPGVGGKWKRAQVEREATAVQQRLNEVKLIEEATKREEFEKATQRDWITEQQAADMGPPREPGPPERGPQRDFWEAEAPIDRGLEESARREGGPIDYTKESPLDLEAKGKETPPVLREDGISYEPTTDGVSKILEQARQADIERAFEKQQSETRSGLPKQTEIDLAYEAVRPEQPGLTFLEQLESDLTNPRGPRQTGPISSATPMGRQRGASDFSVFNEGTQRILSAFPKTVSWIRKHPLISDIHDSLQNQAREISSGKREYFSIDDEFKQVHRANLSGIPKRMLDERLAEIKKLEKGDKWGIVNHEAVEKAEREYNRLVDEYNKGQASFEFVKGVEEFIPKDFKIPDDVRVEIVQGLYKANPNLFRLVEDLWDYETRKHEYSFNKTPQTSLDREIIRTFLYEWANAETSRKHPLAGPGKKQGGAFTPFAKKAPKYEDFVKELKYLKLDHLPEAVKVEMWKGRQKPVPTKLPEATPGREVVEGIKGLDKETQELYNDQRTTAELGADLAVLNKVGGGDIGLDVSLSPNSYRAANHTARRWANSKVNLAYDNAAKEIEALSIGTKYKGTRRVVDPDSPRGRWQSLPKGSKGEINRLGNYLTDKDLPLTEGVAREVLGRDLLPAEVRAMEGIQKVWKYILDEVINKDRVARGLEPIRPRNFYWSPATWAGDYIYFLRDAKGELVHVFGTRFRPDSWLGKAFNRELNRKLKEMGVKLDPQRVRRKTTPEEFSLAGMEVMLENMGKSKDPAVQAVRDLAAEVIAEFNEKRARGMNREGRPGYEGSQTGKTITGYDRGAKAFEQVLDRSLQAAVNIKASQAIMKAYTEFLNEPRTSLFPKAREAASRHFERSLGHQSKGMQWLDQQAANILDKAGLPPSAWDRGVNFTNGLAIRMLMGVWLPIQIGIQVLQPGFALAKMVDLYGKNIKGVDSKLGQFLAAPMVLGALGKTVRDIIIRDNSYMRLLSEEGALSPSMKHEYTGFGETAFGENLGSKARKMIIGDTIQQFMERNVVRAPAARLFYHTLKDIGVTGDALIRITKGLTEDYMVSWDRHKKAGWIANAGAPGRIFGALQSFSTTQLAQFLEYSGKALTKGEVMPLVTFLGTIYVLGGMVGMIGVKEGDAAINLINRMFGLSIPTITEAILTNAQSDTARYGVISAATKTNVSASLGGASVTYVGAPGPSLAWNAGKAVWTLLKYAFKDPSGKPLEEEKREAYKGVAPRVFHGAIEQEFDYTKNQTDARGAGIIKRDEFDKSVRHFGTFSLKEAEAKRRAFINKKEEALLVPKRTQFIERSVQDLIMTGKPPADFIKRAGELKYRNYSEIRQAMLDHLRKKLQTADQRAMGRGTSGRDQRAYMLYQRLMSEEERARAGR